MSEQEHSDWSSAQINISVSNDNMRHALNNRDLNAAKKAAVAIQLSAGEVLEYIETQDISIISGKINLDNLPILYG